MSQIISKEKLIKHFEKTTNLVLNIFHFIKTTPHMSEVSTISEYAEAVEKLLQDLVKILPKKCVPVSMTKKLTHELQSKQQEMKSLLQQQKTMKIQLKVMEQRLAQLENQNNQIDMYQSAESPSIKPFSSSKQIQNHKKNHSQARVNFKNKKKVSLPHLPYVEREIKTVRLRKSVDVFGEPCRQSQILVQHLMNKMGHK